MTASAEFRTARLILRQWRDSDREPFAAMGADPEVMQYFPSLLSRAASDAAIDRLQKEIDERGWGFWALESIESGDFLGFTGLVVPHHEIPCSPCVEIGWRLARPYWGKGYASEAARESLRVGFEHAGLDEIVAYAVLANLRSRSVMERIGMRDANEDFDHPALPEGDPRRKHCLYRITRDEWRRASTTVRLFSYGTLQLEAVQISTFGRKLSGRPDALRGFERGLLAITDAEVVATSGETHHPIVRFTGRDGDEVDGTVFEVTPEEIAQADAYEVDDYVRVRVTLRSGVDAWVYVDARHAPSREAGLPGKIES